MGHMGSWAIPMVSLALDLPTFPPEMEGPGYKSGAPHHEKAGTRTPRPWNRPCRHDPYHPYHGPGLDHLDPEEELLTNHRSEPDLVTKLLPHGLGDKTRNGNGKDNNRQ